MTKKAWFPWVVAGIIGFIIGVAAAGGAEDDNESASVKTETITVSNAPSDAPPTGAEEVAEEEEEPEPASAPEVEVQTKCDYLLDLQGSSLKGTFVGSIEATNEGGTDARVRAVASWKRLGADPIEQEKTFEVAAGQTREIQFSVDAEGGDIDAHQSADGDCEVRREVQPVG